MHKRMTVAAATLVVGGFVGSAGAVALNPDRLGQALVYAYYTANSAHDTLVSLANTGNAGVVASVTFREGQNGRDVLDLEVFLSPHDVWTAALSRPDADGGTVLTSADRSCTWPAIPAAGLAFRSDDYSGAHADSGSQDLQRTLEGSIHVIALGAIVPGSALDLATTHIQNGTADGGVPACTADVVGAAASSLAGDVVTPSADLYGSAAIVDVDEGTFYAYAADALTGFTDRALVELQAPATLADANSADSSFDGGAIATILTRSGRALTLDHRRGLDAVSAVFAAAAMYGEFLVDPALGANTDWIVTFPTKSFYVAPRDFALTQPLAPFVERFGDGVAGASNVEMLATVFDREEGAVNVPGGDHLGVPVSAAPWRLRYEVNAIAFGSSSAAAASSGVFGSTLSSMLQPLGTAGQVALDLASGDGGHAMVPDAAGIVVHGLPVTGFMAYDIVNANARAGILANYGGAFPHRTRTDCTDATGAERCD